MNVGGARAVTPAGRRSDRAAFRWRAHRQRRGRESASTTRRARGGAPARLPRRGGSSLDKTAPAVAPRTGWRWPSTPTLKERTPEKVFTLAIPLPGVGACSRELRGAVEVGGVRPTRSTLSPAAALRWTIGQYCSAGEVLEAVPEKLLRQRADHAREQRDHPLNNRGRRPRDADHDHARRPRPLASGRTGSTGPRSGWAGRSRSTRIAYVETGVVAAAS